MSRNPALEALLQAKFDLDYCADDQREVCLRRFHALLDQAIATGAGPEMTRSKLEEC